MEARDLWVVQDEVIGGLAPDRQAFPTGEVNRMRGSGRWAGSRACEYGIGRRSHLRVEGQVEWADLDAITILQGVGVEHRQLNAIHPSPIPTSDINQNYLAVAPNDLRVLIRNGGVREGNGISGSSADGRGILAQLVLSSLTSRSYDGEGSNYRLIHRGPLRPV